MFDQNQFLHNPLAELYRRFREIWGVIDFLVEGRQKLTETVLLLEKKVADNKALLDTVVADFATFKTDLTAAIVDQTAAVEALKAAIAAGQPDLTAELQDLDDSVKAADAAVKAFDPGVPVPPAPVVPAQ